MWWKFNEQRKKHQKGDPLGAFPFSAVPDGNVAVREGSLRGGW